MDRIDFDGVNDVCFKSKQSSDIACVIKQINGNLMFGANSSQTESGIAWPRQIAICPLTKWELIEAALLAKINRGIAEYEQGKAIAMAAGETSEAYIARLLSE